MQTNKMCNPVIKQNKMCKSVIVQPSDMNKNNVQASERDVIKYATVWEKQIKMCNPVIQIESNMCNKAQASEFLSINSIVSWWYLPPLYNALL